MTRTICDGANIYVLALIQDDFDYNATDHDFSAALAVLWQVDAAATPDMGGGLGNVDIWHWELDCGPGYLSGYNLLSGNDPDCNLDDEWSNSTSNRRDDTDANEVYGSWSHTNMAAGRSRNRPVSPGAVPRRSRPRPSRSPLGGRNPLESLFVRVPRTERDFV